MKRTLACLAGLALLGPLSACSSDPYPDMHLQPVQEVTLQMDANRVSFGRLTDEGRPEAPNHRRRGRLRAERTMAQTQRPSAALP